MDSHTAAQLTHILSEEARMISNELRNNAQNMSADAVVAKLNGLVTRMKSELRNKGSDVLPHEVPIYNSTYRSVVLLGEPHSHPNGKRHIESTRPSMKENNTARSFLDLPPKPLVKTKSIPSSLSTYTHSQKPSVDWRFVQAHPHSHRTPKKSVDEQANLAVGPPHRYSTEKKPRSHSMSCSTNFDRSKYASNPKSQKIVVNVIRDKPSSKKSITWERGDIEPLISAKSQRPLLKGTGSERSKESIPPTKTRPTRSTAAVTELAENTGESGTAEKSRRSQSKPKPEHVTSSDRRTTQSTERKQSEPKRERLRSSKTHTMSKSLVPFVPVSKYILHPPPLYRTPPMLYPPPKPYTSTPRFNYPIPPQFTNTNSLYPFIYYRY